ncbi:MAG: hypothetical protein RDU14_15905 [Melioribacteraceae bacterium]|nr:hypothetical protein [Melioribacteraceae bacterium]
MKKILLNILLLLVITSLSKGQENCRSYLEIETNRDSSLIFINSQFMGYGKIRTEVELGKYFITVKEDLKRWNEHEINDSVIIKLCDKEYLISYNLFDKLYLDTNPQDASIYIYDSLMANTPNFVSVNQFHTVSLRKNGLTKSIHSSELSKYNTIPLEIPVPVRNEVFSESDWFKILVGSATILGSATAYFKIKADNRYDEYLSSRDQKKLDDVNRFDLYGGIAFGLLQVNFGYLIYKFLIE